MMALQFTIPLPPVTKKNSQRVIFTGPQCYACRRGKYAKLLPSAAFLRWQHQALILLPKLERPINEPVTVKATTYVKAKRTSDLTNYLEAVDDLLTKAGILKDDNCCIIVSHDGSRVYHDKDNPRTEVTITPCEEGAPW